MKTSLTISLMLGLALAGCRTEPAPQGAAQGESPATAQQGAAQGESPATAQPGMQPSQAPVLAEQAAQPGPAQAMAQPAAAAGPPGGGGNAQAGQQIASAGTPNGVTACVGCHGAQGEGNEAGGFPRLAGQPAYYLGKQLAAYASGARVNPVMMPIAKAMGAQQIRDVSAYYESLRPGPAAGGAPAAGTAAGGARARTLALVGDEAREVQACINCHGPGGAGEPPQAPYLAGQHPGYLTATMKQWKSGERKTDQSGQMPHIAKALSDADVAALSAYFGAMPPPPPATQVANLPAGSAAKPAVAAAPDAPGPKAPGGAGVFGSGTEQGAPLTGGSQGSGGGGGTQGTLPPAPPVKR
jgi:cytochrome c553